MDINVCRLCCENPGITEIFDEKRELTISSKIMYCCTNIRISEIDGLPSRVCESCEVDLSFTYQFVLKCEAADEKLRSLLLASQIVEYNTGQDYLIEENYAKELEYNFNFDSDRNSPLHDDQVVKPEFIKPIPPLKLKLMKMSKTNANRNTEKQNCDVKEKQTIPIPPLKLKIIKMKEKAKQISKARKLIRKQNCEVCGKLCKNPSTLAIHMRTHSEHRPYTCSFCDKKYKDGGGLKRHIERNHNHQERKRKFVCENCGKAFFSKYDFKIHMRIHTGETPYACRICTQKFTQLGALLRHQLRHTGERTHICSQCNKKFQTKEDLRRHQVVHSKEKNYTCAMCNVHFKYKNNLQKHIKSHLSTSKFICDYCNRSFNIKGNLKIHIDKLHSDKSGFCEVCSKNVPNFEVHMWRHTGKRPLKCDLCSSSYFEKKSLTRHMNFRHKYTDKYKCTVGGCTMSFPSQPMMEYHTAKFHGSSIPFPCDSCSRGFYRKNDLVRHKIRNHTHKGEP